jgi:hypothetical protein
MTRSGLFGRRPRRYVRTELDVVALMDDLWRTLHFVTCEFFSLCKFPIYRRNDCGVGMSTLAKIGTEGIGLSVNLTQ